MRGRKCNGAGLSALTNRILRRSVAKWRHTAIQAKGRAKIKPANKQGTTASQPRNLSGLPKPSLLDPLQFGVYELAFERFN